MKSKDLFFNGETDFASVRAPKTKVGFVLRLIMRFRYWTSRRSTGWEKNEKKKNKGYGENVGNPCRCRARVRVRFSLQPGAGGLRARFPFIRQTPRDPHADSFTRARARVCYGPEEYRRRRVRFFPISFLRRTRPSRTPRYRYRRRWVVTNNINKKSKKIIYVFIHLVILVKRTRVRREW